MDAPVDSPENEIIRDGYHLPESLRHLEHEEPVSWLTIRDTAPSAVGVK
jgi:hypothetical protein